MSTAAERVAGDLIRRSIAPLRGQYASFVIDQEEVRVAFDELMDALDDLLPERSQCSDALHMYPNAEMVNSAFLLETAIDYGAPVMYRVMPLPSLRNLRLRMRRPDHPWHGCVLETEEVEGDPKVRSVYLDASPLVNNQPLD